MQEEATGLAENIRVYKRALTVAEVANLFQMSRQMIYMHARSGNLPSFRIGTSVRFDPKRLVEWLAKQ